MERTLPASRTWTLGLRIPAVLATATFGLLLSVTRSPESIFRAQFWADDGRLYSQALDMGPASIVDPYGGYLLLGQRLVIYVESLLPPYWAPLLGNLVALVAFAAAAAFAASDRMPWSRRTGVLIALGIVAMPAAQPIIGTLSHVQWSVALWIALVALSREPETAVGRRLESAALAFAGVTGMGSMLMWPLFWRQSRRLMIVGATAAVQVFLFLFVADRYAADPVGWHLVGEVVMLRVFATPLIGPYLAGPAGILAGVIILELVVIAAWRWRQAAWVAWLLAVPAIGGIVASTPTDMFIRPELAGRYFFLGGAALVVLIAARWPRSLPLAGILLVGIVVSWRLPSVPDTGWAQRSACIGGPVACTVPVEPDRPKWDVVWQP